MCAPSQTALLAEFAATTGDVRFYNQELTGTAGQILYIYQAAPPSSCGAPNLLPAEVCALLYQGLLKIYSLYFTKYGI